MSHVVVLVHKHESQTACCTRDDCIHDDCVGHIGFGNAREISFCATVDEKTCYEDDECSSDHIGNISWLKTPNTVISKHLKNKLNLLI